MVETRFPEEAIRAETGHLRVLLIDGAAAERGRLRAALAASVAEVLEAETGRAALDLCRERPPDLIVSDAETATRDGIDACHEIRERWPDRFIYVIALTESARGDFRTPLQDGADDCCGKPICAGELVGRLLAAARLLRMERELRERNAQVETSLDRLSEMKRRLDRDLADARKLHRALAPSGPVIREGMRMSFLLQPSDHLGGDLIGWIPLSGAAVGFYAVDVSGQGISSALICARISAWFRGETPERNVALAREGERIVLRPPAEICADVGAMFYETIGGGHTMSMVIGRIDVATGEVVLCRTAHPRPAVQRAGSEVAFVGPEGLPVGLLPDATYASVELRLTPGDRLLVHSDGITAGIGPDGAPVGEAGLARILRSYGAITGPRLFEAMTWELERLAGAPGDDMSGVLIEMTGPG